MAKPTIVTPDEERRMTIIEHLEELRRVLIISLIAWAVATVIGFLLSGIVLGIVLGPIKHVLGPGKVLYFTGPIDKFVRPGKMLIIVFGQRKWNWLRVISPSVSIPFPFSRTGPNWLENDSPRSSS